MNFFEHQDQARKNTRALVLFFLLAVFSLIALTTALVAGFLYYFDSQNQQRFDAIQAVDGGSTIAGLLSWELLAMIAAAVIGVVLLGSLYKLAQLRGGGRVVAESLGGKLISPNTQDKDERKLLNVVEEMAIAAGTPVPPVYLLDEAGINAFAAGYDTKDAVIGITRGCMQLLDRDELQGVIAHEFSHILHGDMRINIRLIGILHGILVIGLLGSMLLRGGIYSHGYSRNRSDNRSGIALIGLGLLVIGYAGTFFGNLIKSAVSRQREFLADASAVQFTRNPDGISGALQKIGGYTESSHINHPHAEEFSHMYFGTALRQGLGSLFATHPPLDVRIKRIDPQWQGRFPQTDSATATAGVGNAANLAGAQVSAFNDVAAPAAGEHSQQDPLELIGAPGPQELATARRILSEIPEQLIDSAHDPFAARALIYNLLIDEDHAEGQWQQLRKRAHPVVYKLTQELYPSIRALVAGKKLSLVELAIPALKSLSDSQYQVFKENLIALIKLDGQVTVFEWSLYRLLMNNLEPPQHQRSANATVRQLGSACQRLLSVVATAGHNSEKQAESAFELGMKQLGLANMPLLSDGKLNLPMLDQAISQLQRLKPLQKPALLKALLTCVEHDGEITEEEFDLFRAIADCLDCPVPPMSRG